MPRPPSMGKITILSTKLTFLRYAKIGERRAQAGKSQLAVAHPNMGQPADEFTFGHTGHMAIILGRNDGEQAKPGLFENIKEKAKSGFSATKRNFL